MSCVFLVLLLQRAFSALCHSTHLYGRRLVLEWADAEVTLQALRRKTAEHFHGKLPWADGDPSSSLPRPVLGGWPSGRNPWPQVGSAPCEAWPEVRERRRVGQGEWPP